MSRTKFVPVPASTTFALIIAIVVNPDIIVNVAIANTNYFFMSLVAPFLLERRYVGLAVNRFKAIEQQKSGGLFVFVRDYQSFAKI